MNNKTLRDHLVGFYGDRSPRPEQTALLEALAEATLNRKDSGEGSTKKTGMSGRRAAAISLVAASFTKTIRTEINLTRNLIESAKAETLA